MCGSDLELSRQQRRRKEEPWQKKLPAKRQWIRSQNCQNQSSTTS